MSDILAQSAHLWGSEIDLEGQVKLMGLDAERDTFFEDLLDVVQSEPNYLVRILARANSVASGSRSEITTLQGALSRIGSRHAKDLVFSLSVAKVFVPRDDWEKSLWRHAIHVAIASRDLARIAKDPEVRPDEAYTCGLLHDIGRFVLFQEGPEDLRRIDEGDWDTPEGLIEMERSICGWTHSDLGALACEHWGLPRLIREVVRQHHNLPERNPRGRVAKIAALVRAADLAMFSTAMPGSSGHGDADDETLRLTVQAHLPPFVRIGIPELREALRAMSEEASQAIQELGI